MNDEFKPYSLKDIEELDKENFMEYVEDFLYYEDTANIKRLVRLLASNTVDNAKNTLRMARMLEGKQARAMAVMALESYNTLNKCIHEVSNTGNKIFIQYDNECGHGEMRKEQIAHCKAGGEK